MNITVVVLEDEERQTKERVRTVKRLVSSEDGHVTGKGIIAKAAKLVRISTHGKSPVDCITANYTALPSDTTAAVEAVLKTSSKTAEGVVRYRLRRIFTGGLPGSEKRK